MKDQWIYRPPQFHSANLAKQTNANKKSGLNCQTTEPTDVASWSFKTMKKERANFRTHCSEAARS
jgi:hypothetical protein